MKKFFERIKKDYDDQLEYEYEPLFFKCFLWFTYIPYCIFYALGILVIFFTVPLWIIPYMIYWNNKGETKIEQCKKCALYNSLGCPYNLELAEKIPDCDEFRPREEDE